VVLIAHGFAGSQQLMRPFAESLAHNSYIAVTFDFPGHNRKPRPLRGGVTDGKKVTTELLEELSTVATFAREQPDGDGRFAVIGHSMASDIVVWLRRATSMSRQRWRCHCSRRS
jgi:alpha-beta hydrolase superfamily lysophospholipase